MTPVATALAELIAAGVTGNALVTAIERIENATYPSRTANAERQARFRERQRALQVTQSVTSDEPHIDTKKEIKKEKKVSTALPLHWLPSNAGLALAREQGWDEHKVKLEIHRFQDHATANNRRQADWDAAWRNWVTSPYQQKANGHGHGKPKQSLVEIGRDLAERARAAELAAGIRREDDPIGSD